MFYSNSVSNTKITLNSINNTNTAVSDLVLTYKTECIFVEPICIVVKADNRNLMETLHVQQTFPLKEVS